jgi:hypothetical protein
MPRLNLTSTELTKIVDKLEPGFADCVKNYAGDKYPLDAYSTLLAAFASPEKLSGGDIRRALEWKFGHWVKADYPEAHRRLIDRIASKWPEFRPSNPGADFKHWMGELKGAWTAPYITVTFLIHLLRPHEFPIVDQHTFRAMNDLLAGVRPGRSAKKTPSTFDDLETYAEFFRELQTLWARRDATIDRSALDRGLMVYGQRRPRQRNHTKERSHEKRR